jgi:hypothetical protein
MSSSPGWAVETVSVWLETSSSSCCCRHHFRCHLVRRVATDSWSVCSKRSKFNTTLLTGKILSSLLAPLEGDGWFWRASTCRCASLICSHFISQNLELYNWALARCNSRFVNPHLQQGQAWTMALLKLITHGLHRRSSVGGRFLAGRRVPKFECHVDLISLERDGTLAIHILPTWRWGKIGK